MPFRTQILSFPCSGSGRMTLMGCISQSPFPCLLGFTQWENRQETEEWEEMEMGTLPGPSPAGPSHDGG